MWIANLDTIEKQDGNVVATITFTSDTGEVQKRVVPGNTLTNATIANFAADCIQAFDMRDASYAVLTTGAITVPAKTTDQLAAIAAIQAS